jgi:hypothetical protein
MLYSGDQKIIFYMTLPFLVSTNPHVLRLLTEINLTLYANIYTLFIAKQLVISKVKLSL